jgi:hypothetical protein
MRSRRTAVCSVVSSIVLWNRNQRSLTERQAHTSERSVAQTECSLIKQGQILREQNERARLSLEVDFMYKLQERLDSQRFQDLRNRHLTHLRENPFVDDEMVSVQHLDAATEKVLDFFEEIGRIVVVGVRCVE